MIAEEKVIGVIQAQSLREGAYSEADIPLLSIIANQAAIAIQNARLYQDAVEARRAMEQANKIKDEFLAMLSHELRTPLTPILGWTRILGKLSPTDVQTRNHALEVIERNARLQSQLVNDLLDLSRIGSGKLAINLQPTDINRAVRAAVESIRAEAESRNIEIEALLAQSEAIVMADQSRLGQIINNLLTNAVKFSNANGRIIVLTEITGDYCALTVKDNGLGIAPDFLPHVFDKFRQEDGSTRRRHSGLGLGLSMVKSLVEMHGGHVSAHSDGVGSGATFTVRLPVAVQKAAARHVARPRESAPPAAQGFDGMPELRLLIIEDDADTLEMMRVLCDAQNIKVTGARTAEEGFQMLNSKKPDIIISDIRLPGMDGHELARKLRADAKLNGVPLIAITGLASDADRSLALDAGFDAHLSKPINYGEMFELVRRLTSQQVASDR
jgi:signal transduction histidine kinase/CheY-like chemotaxis protein